MNKRGSVSAALARARIALRRPLKPVAEGYRLPVVSPIRIGRSHLPRADIFVCVFSALAVFPAASAFGQTITIAPGADSGQIEQHLQVPRAPQATHESPIFEDDRLVPTDEVGELSLVLKSVTVEGSTVYADEDLAHLYEEWLGQEITLAKVFDIVDAITAKYRNDGYVLSRAVLPPQTITDGEVRIRIVEGYINDVRIEGETGRDPSLLHAYIAKLKGSRPLSIEGLERYLLLIGDLPGIRSKAVVKPSKDTPGAADLVILVEEKAMDGFFRIDNRGTKYNGPTRFWLGAGFNSLSHNRTEAKYVIDKDNSELAYFDIGHEHQIGTEGGKLYLQITHTDSEPGHALEELEIESKSESFSSRFAHPLIRSRARNLWLHAGLVVRNSETTIFGNRLSRDRIRFIGLGLLYDSADSLGGINQVGLDIDQGLDILNASERGSTELSRERGRAKFTRLRLNASRLQRLSGNWSLLASAMSQFASSKLLASEEFGVGGERCGRAYDASEVTGDHGACLLVEVRYGRNFGVQGGGYQLYGFYDIGGVWRRDPGALKKKADLSSTGLGVRFNFTEWLSGSLEAAWPLTTETDSRKIDISSQRGFFTLTGRF